MKIKTILYEDLVKANEKLDTTEFGTDERKATVDEVVKIADRLIEVEKIEVEQKHKAKQMKDDQIDKWVRHGLTVGTTLLSAGVFIWGTVGTWKFDAEHTITSTQGRGIINGLLPKCLKL